MTKARDLANASTALSAVSATELGYLDGVTSAIQTQVDGKSATSHNHDSAYINQTTFDAKGDLIVGTADNTYSRLGAGSNGDTIVADSSTSTGLRYTAGNPISNPVLNSCFDIWQRGTSILATASVNAYQADRWQGYSASANITVSRQATNDTTNLPFIQYCARAQRTAGNSSVGGFALTQNFETINSIPYAGKTVTFSFYARAGANFSSTSNILKAVIGTGTGTDQNWQSGFTGFATPINQNATLTTTWQRFTYTGTVAATATQIATYFEYTPTGTAGANDYFEVTGVQLDIGSVALPVRRNGATIQGELAAASRYYQRQMTSSCRMGVGFASSTSGGQFVIALPVAMRTAPTSMEYGGTIVWFDGVTGNGIGTMTLVNASTVTAGISFTGSSGLTQYRPLGLSGNSSDAYLAFSAEL